MSSKSRQLFPLLACAMLAACGKESPSPVAPMPLGDVAVSAPRPFAGPSGVLVGAGDIGYCRTAGAEATARLLDRISGTVFTAGDNAYVSGSRDEFRTCYDPTWGRHRSRTRPTPGNHEYATSAAAYFEYFGGTAGPSGAGY